MTSQRRWSSRSLDRVEGLAIPSHGVVGCERSEGLVAGSDRVADGLVDLGRSGRGEPMRCEFTDPVVRVVPGERFDRLRDLAVEPSPSTDREVFVESVLHERMRKREPIARTGNFGDEPGGHRGFQNVEHGVIVEIDRTRDHCDVEIAAHYRGRAQHPVRVLTKAAHRAPTTSRTLCGRPAVEVDGRDPPAVVLLRDRPRLRQVE